MQKRVMKEIRYTGVSVLTLFLSLGTLICCVLPIILVTLGLGTVLATLISQFPIFVVLYPHKIWIFLISAFLLLFTAWLLWRSEQSCPVDPGLAATCHKIQKWNKRIFWVALSIWLIGFVTTYIFLPLWIWTEG